VLVYLLGLGAAGYLGVAAAHEQADEEYARSCTFAAERIATEIGHLGGYLAPEATSGGEPPATAASSEETGEEVNAGLTKPSPPESTFADLAARAGFQRILRQGSSELTTAAMRVMDQKGVVVASLDASEIGGQAPILDMRHPPPRRFETVELSTTGTSRRQHLLRCPIWFKPPTAPVSRPIPTPALVRTRFPRRARRQQERQKRRAPRRRTPIRNHPPTQPTSGRRSTSKSSYPSHPAGAACWPSRRARLA
jgi:hypothetical protein